MERTSLKNGSIRDEDLKERAAFVVCSANHATLHALWLLLGRKRFALLPAVSALQERR